MNWLGQYVDAGTQHESVVRRILWEARGIGKVTGS